MLSVSGPRWLGQCSSLRLSASASASLPRNRGEGKGVQLQSVGPGVVIAPAPPISSQQNDSQEMLRNRLRGSVTQWMLTNNQPNVEPGIWYHKMKHWQVVQLRVRIRGYRVHAFLWWGLQGSCPVWKSFIPLSSLPVCSGVRQQFGFPSLTEL